MLRDCVWTEADELSNGNKEVVGRFVRSWIR